MQLNQKDNKKRLKIYLLENKRRCLKSLKINKHLLCSRWSRHKLNSLAKSNIRNRCLITQRGKSIKKDFKLSRIELKRWVKNNIFFGIQQASW